MAADLDKPPGRNTNHHQRRGGFGSAAQILPDSTGGSIAMLAQQDGKWKIVAMFFPKLS
jgi:hypothetical protein